MLYKVPKCNKQLIRNFSTRLEMPAYELKQNKYTGPSLTRTEEIQTRHIPPILGNFYKKPLMLHQGHKQWVFDHEGKRYLDLFGGIVTVSVGHCHPKVTSVLREQAGNLWHTTTIYRHPKIYEYTEKLLEKLPNHLQVVYFVNSGSEANDLAVVLSRLYTGNQDIISLTGSYHGCSSGLMRLTSTQSFIQPNLAQPGFHHAMLPDPYRGIWKGCRDSLSQVPEACSCPDDCESSDKYIHQLSELMENSLPSGRVAALFAECIQGVHGVVQLTKGYLKKAEKLVRKNGGLLVIDEVQTGFGRTGDSFWAFEGECLTPDIVTMAKGMGNGFPLAALVTTKEIADAHTKALYFSTFGGNALACAVGKAVLEVIEEENLQDNSKTVGRYFIEQLMHLQKNYPIIGDVRGKGLMIAMELVNPGTKKPLDKAAEIFETIRNLGILLGLGGRFKNVMRITPPMCITKDDVDFTIAVLEAAFKSHEFYK